MAARRSRFALLTAVTLAILTWWHFRNPPPPPVLFRRSKFDWSSARKFHPPSSIKPLPQGQPRRLPQVQADARLFKQTQVSEQRRSAVRDEFLRSYNSYKAEAWLLDELLPIKGGGKNTFGGLAATLVDSLDTLWIMGLEQHFNEAAQAAASLDWSNTQDTAVNLFETTIRHLGGLLSAYELSHEKALLQKALELGEMLYVAFDTPNRLPGFWLNFDNALAGTQMAGTHDPSASPASLSLELTRLSQLTGNPKFYDAADRVTQFLARVQNETRLPGMWPVALNFQDGVANDNTFSLGALADSLYEYLPKMYALMGGLDGTYETLYRVSAEVVIDNLLFRPMIPDGQDILFLGDLHMNDKADLSSESQHLTCFAGGMFALGGRLLGIKRHVEIGEQLARGCGWAYSAFPTGIMPEIFDILPCKTLDKCAWDEDRWKEEGNSKLPRGFRHARDPRYILRPEAIESIFVMYRITADPQWQDMAWDMFQSIISATWTKYGNAAIEDVTNPKSPKIDSMESFWLSETLKYFYLIFSPPDLISLDRYVLNTEAHPLRRPVA
ncbi:Endoplasmic reticulum mannosyl-oligosaccharide 1,2-alpha-mannosidase [Paramyrothecium foliicola]|nr:Endoplasmic reticulum mannosyl-oligosaccharide 1,2-alpha-mannosidase [Paramyrothecium foliicola]